MIVETRSDNKISTHLTNHSFRLVRDVRNVVVGMSRTVFILIDAFLVVVVDGFVVFCISFISSLSVVVR